jgi:NAD(P)H dehydrogenase (quinone)
VLQQIGLDEATAEFVVAIDASIAAGDIETDSNDLARLLRRQPTPLAETFRVALAGR